MASVLISCGSLEDKIAEDMQEHCECVSEKGMKDESCRELLKSIIEKYEKEEGAALLIQDHNVKCGEKLIEDGKHDASIRVR